MEPISTARTSFSGDFFFDESNFISINPHSPIEFLMKDPEELKEKDNSSSSSGGGSTAGELLFQGKLLPFWQVLKQSRERNNGIGFGDVKKDDEGKAAKKEKRRVSWFVDDDDNPSPRPPRCTVLWKELLRSKKQRASSLMPSASTRSSMKARKGLFQHK